MIKQHAKELEYLQKFMDWSASHLFKDKALPNIVLTITYQKGSYGYCTTYERFVDENNKYYEISYNMDYLNRPIYEIFDTLIHEQIHAYCRLADIKEVNSTGKYHNKKFKDLAEELGLKTEQVPRYGYNTCGLTDVLQARIDKEFLSENPTNGIFELKTQVKPIGKAASKNKNYKKYVCPTCGQVVRAKAGANVICGDCHEHMEEKI